MAGHISEQLWVHASDKANRSLAKLVEFLLRVENECQELLGLWAFHGQDDQAVADQLFSETNNGSPATAEQIQMTLDLKAAMIAAHNLHDTADFTAMRKMT